MSPTTAKRSTQPLDGESQTPSMELITETGQSSQNTEATETRSLPFRMMVVLTPDMLAAAITRAHDVKMAPDKFALRSAQLIMNILPPLYYEPRNNNEK